MNLKKVWFCQNIAFRGILCSFPPSCNTFWGWDYRHSYLKDFVHQYQRDIWWSLYVREDGIPESDNRWQQRQLISTWDSIQQSWQMLPNLYILQMCSQWIRNVIILRQNCYCAKCIIIFNICQWICNECKHNSNILGLCLPQILIVHQAFGFEWLSYSEFCFQIWDINKSYSTFWVCEWIFRCQPFIWKQ